jgi:hypothetical protein
VTKTWPPIPYSSNSPHNGTSAAVIDLLSDDDIVPAVERSSPNSKPSGRYGITNDDLIVSDGDGDANGECVVITDQPPTKDLPESVNTQVGDKTPSNKASPGLDDPVTIKVVIETGEDELTSGEEDDDDYEEEEAGQGEDNRCYSPSESPCFSPCSSPRLPPLRYSSYSQHSASPAPKMRLFTPVSLVTAPSPPARDTWTPARCSAVSGSLYQPLSPSYSVQSPVFPPRSPIMYSPSVYDEEDFRSDEPPMDDDRYQRDSFSPSSMSVSDAEDVEDGEDGAAGSQKEEAYVHDSADQSDVLSLVDDDDAGDAGQVDETDAVVDVRGDSVDDLGSDEVPCLEMSSENDVSSPIEPASESDDEISKDATTTAAASPEILDAKEDQQQHAPSAVIFDAKIPVLPLDNSGLEATVVQQPAATTVSAALATDTTKLCDYKGESRCEAGGVTVLVSKGEMEAICSIEQQAPKEISTDDAPTTTTTTTHVGIKRSAQLADLDERDVPLVVHCVPSSSSAPTDSATVTPAENNSNKRRRSSYGGAKSRVAELAVAFTLGSVVTLFGLAAIAE